MNRKVKRKRVETTCWFLFDVRVNSELRYQNFLIFSSLKKHSLIH